MKPDLQDILVNCARLCIVNKKPEEAIKHFLKIVKHNEFSLCSLGLAYYHTGNYDKCDKAYIEAEKFASSEEIKSSILAARSIIIKQVQGLKKMKLFLENSEVNYFEGLRMLCALSILENDTKLARTTLAELEQYKDDPKYLFSITFLNSCFYIIQEKKEDAKRQLCKAVFKFPNNGFTWIHLAFILLHQYNNSSVSLKIMKAASLLHKTVLNSPLTPLCHLAAGNVKSGLKESEKLLHLRPDSPSNWVLLLTCSRAARIPNINHLFRFVENLVETNKHCTKLLTYLCLEKVIYHLDTNNLSDAKLTLDKVEAKDNYTLRVIEFMNILCNLIDGPTSLDGECLKRLEVQCRKIPTFTWAILETVKLYLKVKKEEEAIEFLQQLLLYEKTSPSSRWMLHIQLSLIAYRILKEDPGRHRYESVCRRNAEEAARLRPRSPISHFLTAAAAEVAGDSRWRERSLRRVWENTGGEEELRIRELSRRILDQIRRPEDHSAPF
ncbi:uncharacterized protein LOC111626906 isoform X2 [Centruroides sculpturatus]|uniref:uncharacterized protein LOC111626906 isoform X2 n=1 Tax=Centruroides sculpturatus TaxID=218467 RepID=UPI000C6E32C0|nr:uncharacterized protein LOC111626906 isoform X2 [Centruroides sculpturatus]